MSTEPIHRWYTSVMGFAPQLVNDLINELGCDSSGTLLDPFCGTGTTLVESNRREINAIGIDANPFSVFCSKAKTDLNVNPERLLTDFNSFINQPYKTENLLDEYAVMPLSVRNGWVSPYIWNKAAHIYRETKTISNPRIRNLVKLAILSTVKEELANIAFGPEIYKRKRKNKTTIKKALSNKIEQIAFDLKGVNAPKRQPKIDVVFDDSRNLQALAKTGNKIKWVISSPPYPTEHDYSRISRIELELGGFVKSQEELRAIKRLQIRSNSKTVYSDDKDWELIKNVQSITRIVDRIKKLSESKTHSFARRYPLVVANYFGGLYLHLASLADLMPSGGRCAYVLGEQRSYLGVFIPTPEIFNELACKKLKAFKLVKKVVVQIRKGTSGKTGQIKEEAVILERR